MSTAPMEGPRDAGEQGWDQVVPAHGEQIRFTDRGQTAIEALADRLVGEDVITPARAEEILDQVLHVEVAELAAQLVPADAVPETPDEAARRRLDHHQHHDPSPASPGLAAPERAR